MAATYLDEIIAWHRSMDHADDASLGARALAASEGDPPRGFAASLGMAAGRLAVIAEVKRRSPSKGPLSESLDPAALAAQYAAGGARCISVLTDAKFFGGSPEDLIAARGACELPVLRKDFTLCLADVYEARIMGADAVLLIAAALGDAKLELLAGASADLGMDALVEVHDGLELERALAAGASLIGVNQRDLFSFEVDSERAVSLAAAIPPGVLGVAESGIGGLADAERLASAGYEAVLVGELLVRSPDPAPVVQALSGVPVSSRVQRRGRLPCS